MAKPILYLFRGGRNWMLSRESRDDEGMQPARCTAILLLREVDVEAALQRVQAALPAYDIRVLNWQRPELDHPPLH